MMGPNFLLNCCLRWTSWARQSRRLRRSSPLSWHHCKASKHQGQIHHWRAKQRQLRLLGHSFAQLLTFHPSCPA